MIQQSTTNNTPDLFVVWCDPWYANSMPTLKKHYIPKQQEKTYIRKKCFLHAANKCMFRIHPQTGRCKPSNTSVSTGAAKNIWNYLCSPQQNILYISLSFSIPWKRPFFSSVNVIYIYINKYPIYANLAQDWTVTMYYLHKSILLLLKKHFGFAKNNKQRYTAKRSPTRSYTQIS